MTPQPAVPDDKALSHDLRSEDGTLIDRCLRGEETAWAALISRYKNLIFSVPIKYGFSPEDSADIFQSVCLDLLCELNRLREPKALPAWIIQITYHKCFHQSRIRQRQVTDNQGIELLVADADLPDTQLQELQRDQALRSALTSLSPRCHQLVKQLFFESPTQPYNQIAKSMSLATGSIGSIRQRCLIELRKILEQAGFP